MTAPYKPRPPGSFKDAFAALVTRCGGQKAVAALLGCSAQNVARMTDADFPKSSPRLDQVILLEKHCGARIVSDWMAAEHGCVIEQMHTALHESLPIMLGRITSEMGELLSAAARDVQAGTLTRTNAANILRETDGVVGAVLTLRAAARDMLEENA